MNSYYDVIVGDTIVDVAFNTCGSLAGIDQILEDNMNAFDPPASLKYITTHGELPKQNNMESYSPDISDMGVLYVGNLVVYNLDATLGRKFNSYSSYTDTLNVQIEQLENILK